MINPLTPAGIEPATFRFVAQHPNHCSTAVPQYLSTHYDISHWLLHTAKAKMKVVPIHVQKINHGATLYYSRGCWLSTADRTFSIIGSLIVNYVLL